jgi:UDP-3-O-[3-hydroxymyristoyl] glucosamine N-acyltransferase
LLVAGCWRSRNHHAVELGFFFADTIIATDTIIAADAIIAMDTIIAADTIIAQDTIIAPDTNRIEYMRI